MIRPSVISDRFGIVLTGERLLQERKHERRGRISRLRRRAILQAVADVDRADLEAIAGHHHKAVLVHADRNSSLLRSLDDAGRHMIGHAEGALDPAFVGIFGEQSAGDLCGLALIPIAVLDVDDLVIGIFVHHRFEAVHAHGHFRLNLSAGHDEDIRGRAAFLLQALDEVGRGELAQLPMIIFDRRLVVGR